MALRLPPFLSASRSLLNILGGFSSSKVTSDGKFLTLEVAPLAKGQFLATRPVIYGGAITGNLLLAASKLAGPNHRAMAINVDYLTYGRYDKMQTFTAQLLRKSENFSHVSVVLEQEGQTVAAARATFHIDEPNGSPLQYHAQFPDNCSSPKSLIGDVQSMCSLAERPETSADVRLMSVFWLNLLVSSGIDSFPVEQNWFEHGNSSSKKLLNWIHFTDKETELAPALGLHFLSGLTAWVSDLHPMFTIVRQQPHFGTLHDFTSLGHFVWLVSDHFSTKNWLLYETETTISGNNVAMCEGRLWNEDKTLLAVTKQHSVVRPRGP